MSSGMPPSNDPSKTETLKQGFHRPYSGSTRPYTLSNKSQTEAASDKSAIIDKSQAASDKSAIIAKSQAASDKSAIIDKSQAEAISDKSEAISDKSQAEAISDKSQAVYPQRQVSGRCHHRQVSGRIPSATSLRPYAIIDKSQADAIIDKSRADAIIDKSRADAIIDKSRADAIIDKSQAVYPQRQVSGGGHQRQVSGRIPSATSLRRRPSATSLKPRRPSSTRKTAPNRQKENVKRRQKAQTAVIGEFGRMHHARESGRTSGGPVDESLGAAQATAYPSLVVPVSPIPANVAKLAPDFDDGDDGVGHRKAGSSYKPREIYLVMGIQPHQMFHGLFQGVTAPVRMDGVL
ncbi:hypothetical protein BJ508DRAFT_315984 [Ascobolus immersus RN42]|uniref:Uncharacterized protein n=1 Tax=Ascobolus immersus RN42 TaxID=1160509 RepID=A0A3N4H8B4_ASCIM|nr:hypothetical protein BJ508DRAFT_315984 [Ascobolus immersus RN42]